MFIELSRCRKTLRDIFYLDQVFSDMSDEFLFDDGADKREAARGKFWYCCFCIKYYTLETL